MTLSWWWFIQPETAISINRNGSITLRVFKTHYRDRRPAIANHRIFMQIQFPDHTRLRREGHPIQSFRLNVADHLIGRVVDHSHCPWVLGATTLSSSNPHSKRGLAPLPSDLGDFL